MSNKQSSILVGLMLGIAFILAGFSYEAKAVQTQEEIVDKLFAVSDMIVCSTLYWEKGELDKAELLVEVADNEINRIHAKAEVKKNTIRSMVQYLRKNILPPVYYEHCEKRMDAIMDELMERSAYEYNKEVKI